MYYLKHMCIYIYIYDVDDTYIIYIYRERYDVDMHGIHKSRPRVGQKVGCSLADDHRKPIEMLSDAQNHQESECFKYSNHLKIYTHIYYISTSFIDVDC